MFIEFSFRGFAIWKDKNGDQAGQVNFMRKMILVFAILLMPLSTAWAQGMVLEKITGEVSVLKKGQADWISAQNGAGLEAGDKVKTGEKSGVSIKG